MGEATNISWCDHTWNFAIGCTKVSPACDGCYAEAMMDKRYHRVEWGGPGKGNGTRVRTSEHVWNDPIRWNRKAQAAGEIRFVFCCSLADVFDNQIPPEWRADAFAVMRKTENLVYLLLTKRPGNIAAMSAAAGGLPRNCAIGTTVEDDDRLVNLYRLAMAADIVVPAFTFASFEPLLEIIDPSRIPIQSAGARFNAWTGELTMDDFPLRHHRLPPLGWAITGGETDQGGHKARPTHPDAFRTIQRQAARYKTPYHHKQNGEWVSVSEVPGDGAHHVFLDGATVRRVGKKLSGRTIDGQTYDEFPAIRTLGFAPGGWA